MPNALEIYNDGNYIGLSKNQEFEYFSYLNELYKIHRSTGFVTELTNFDMQEFEEMKGLVCN